MTAPAWPSEELRKPRRAQPNAHVRTPGNTRQLNSEDETNNTYRNLCIQHSKSPHLMSGSVYQASQRDTKWAVLGQGPKQTVTRVESYNRPAGRWLKGARGPARSRRKPESTLSMSKKKPIRYNTQKIVTCRLLIRTGAEVWLLRNASCTV